MANAQYLCSLPSQNTVGSEYRPLKYQTFQSFDFKCFSIQMVSLCAVYCTRLTIWIPDQYTIKPRWHQFSRYSNGWAVHYSNVIQIPDHLASNLFATIWIKLYQYSDPHCLSPMLKIKTNLSDSQVLQECLPWSASASPVLQARQQVEQAEAGNRFQPKLQHQPRLPVQPQRRKSPLHCR